MKTVHRFYVCCSGPLQRKDLKIVPRFFFKRSKKFVSFVSINTFFDLFLKVIGIIFYICNGPRQDR